MNEMNRTDDTASQNKASTQTRVPPGELLSAIVVKSVTVVSGRFFGETRNGGSVSVSQSCRAGELMVTKIQSLNTKRPPSYVGRAPRKEYLKLLQEVLANHGPEKK